jgi:hypothetical protein
VVPIRWLAVKRLGAAIVWHAALALLAGWACRGVAAQAAAASDTSERPSAALFASAGALAGDGALDSALQAALDALGVVRVTVRPGLDLEAVQLAIDCVAQSAACLHAVAAQSGVQVLIAPTIVRTDSALVLTLLRFDVRMDNGNAAPVRVARKQVGTQLKPELLDAIPSMLRELFGLSADQAAAPVAAAEPSAPPDELPVAAYTHQKPALTGPLILGSAGALLVAGGVVTGLVMQSTHSEYLKLPKSTETEIDHAIQVSSRGQTQATVANVLYGVGAAAIVASAIWLAIELGNSSERNPSYTALVPALGPGQLGVSLLQRGPSL